MAENFQAGVCGPTWWNPSRSGLGLSSPCSPLLNDHIASFGWSTEPLLNSKAATSGNSDESGSVVSDHEFFKPPQLDSGGSDGGGPAVFMDSALQMLGIDLSSPSSTTTTTTSDWNQQSLLGSGRSESNYNPTILQEAEMNSGLNFRQETGMGCLTPVSGDCTASFPATMSSAYPTTLLQTLLDTTNPPLPQQQPLFDDWSLNYSPSMNYPVNLSQFSLPSLGSSIPKQQNLCSWNNSGGSTFVPSAKAQYSASTFEEKQTCPMLSSKVNNTEVAHDQSGSMAKRNSNEPGPTFKRPRIETPSPLPTFKVRKEKLGDRITALQQLVSPFGKTDTASVLQEAIEYIKFLHDQVNVLSTPYIKNGAAQYHQNSNKDSNDSEDPKQDLRSRGLCLVPISSTFPVATETTADFWTPTFGGSYR